MSDSNTGQVNASAAEVYEEFFLPALFHAQGPDYNPDWDCSFSIHRRLVAY